MPQNGNADEVNRKISQELLKDGTFYVVSTTLNDKFYLRVTLMNSLTDKEALGALLMKIQEIAKNSF